MAINKKGIIFLVIFLTIPYIFFSCTPYKLQTSEETITPANTPIISPSYGQTIIPETISNEQIDDIFYSFIRDDSPGGAVIVIKNGKILYKSGYGLADIENDIPITPKTIFQIGSTGKQFTALAVLMLAEDGMVKLDDPIGNYLPELARFGDKFTIRHLLNHTSGIPDYSDDEELSNDLFSISPEPTNKDALKLLSKKGSLLFTPGKKFLYSNSGYDMLGSLIEEISGQSYADFMEKRIFSTLNMKSTFSLPNPDKLKNSNLAHSYEEEDNKIKAYDSDPMDYLVGSGSIYSTVEDMYLYDQALYNDKLIKQSTLSEAFKPGILNDGTRTDYGFGWELGTHTGKKYVRHDGAWLAFISYYIRFPEEHLSVIVLLNRDYDLPKYEIEMKIADLFLKNNDK